MDKFSDIKQMKRSKYFTAIMASLIAQWIALTSLKAPQSLYIGITIKESKVDTFQVR